MSYLIVLDTNIIFNDFFFKSSDMKKLLKFTQHKPVDLCITEFNYHEILKKFKDEIRPLIKTVKSTKADLIRLEASEIINFENLKADIFVEKYKNTFDGIIEENNIKIIDFPKSNGVTKKISLKYFNNEKPFDENKVSFQDAIIWESIVEYCSDNEPDQVAFISNNHKDFANRDKSDIHDDLAGDIQNLSYYNSLSAFLENEEDNLRDYFNDNYEYDEESLINDLKSFCERSDFMQNTIDDMLMNSQFDGEYFSGWGTDGYIEEYDITINEVSLDIEDNAMLISFDIEVDVSFRIETVDPSYEYGDSGDGMMSESSSTNILIHSNVTYSLENKALIDYVELDREFC
ncbi:PIN domain-containing protein [Bacillus pseudomycoides]|uniref:PIN domain-containing protein n=1 Tax=Bacillus bingmayongensis TaxID=1150157 RepID=A0ABU5K6H0_9BACI|nr:PIN domain-containing protein [Bacillus pseudomycoides]